MTRVHEIMMKQRDETPHPDRVIALSGAFDIIRPGHTRMIQAALSYGKVVIILNSDEWVQRNKGARLLKWDDRREVLLSIWGVSEVVPVQDADDTVCEALQRIKPHVFGNGGYRVKGNTPERSLCQELGIGCVWGLGGGEHDSYSLSLLDRVYDTKRPAGSKKRG